MKKVILLSTVLGLGALGMACGEAPANNTAVKPAVNTAVINAVNAAANNVQAAANQMQSAANQMANAVKPANMAVSSNTSKTNSMAPANANAAKK